MLFAVDDDMNISITRGYPVDIPVQVRRANQADYALIPGKDTLIFTVRSSASSQVNAFQVTSTEAVIPLVSSHTAALPYGTYLYDLVLRHEERGEVWTDTILGPCKFIIGGDDDVVLDGYRKLLTSEYKTRPRLTSWLLWLLSEGLTYNSVLNELLEAFNLDTAVGQQLDTLGKIAGVGRTLSFYPSDGSGPVMDDETYRLVIKARLIQNLWKGTLDELYSAWGVLFPGIDLQIQDLQTQGPGDAMTYNVVISGDFTSLMRELIVNGYIVPKPEGVRINNLLITDTTGKPLFAYDLNDADFSGYTAHWAEPL